MTFWYCPDCSKITSYNLSEGIPGMLMNDYSFVFHGDEVVDNDGEVVINGFKKVMLTAPFYNSQLYWSDNALSNGTSSLHRLMRQHFVAMDGMNE
ncbi:MAG: hypothetical protein MJY68_06520 [Bacteroidaceae bacterium]|nr:hypothetical protein [Bacteroidaceae bacterium]